MEEKKKKNIWILFFAIAFFSGLGITPKKSNFLLFAQETVLEKSEYPSIEPIFIPQEFLKIEKIPTKLSPEEFVQISLLYSECVPGSNTYDQCLGKFYKLREAVTDSQIIALSEQERGRQILKIIYENVLTHYEANQTRLDVALQTGSYNCVSSALIYMAVAKAAGLDVRGQKTPNHAFCSVYIGGKKIDVETTNPYGFNPGSKESIEKENEIKGYYIVPKTYYSNRQEVSDVLFAGLVAGNICSDCVEKNNYKKAVPLGAARYLAVKDEKTKAAAEVRKDFDVLAANFVNILPENANAFIPKLEWYCSFVNRWGMTDFLQNNMDNAVNNLLVLCYDEKNYKLADEGWNKFKDFVSVRRLSAMEEMLVDIFIASLNNLMNSHKYNEGYETATHALSQIPDSTKIKSMQKSFYNNCIATIHNNFAEAANARNYEKARRILNDGLNEFPNDKTLNKDYSDLKKVMGE